MQRNCLNTFWQCVLITVALIIGFCIYILFRQNVLFVEFIFGVKDGFFCHLNSNNPLSYFIIYCLPDGLWYLALLHTNHMIGNLVSAQNDRFTLTIDTMSMSAPFVLEIGQATGHLAGTFDFCDILTYLFTLISYSIWKRKKSVM